MRLFVHGDAGFNYAIKVSSDLNDWQPLATAYSTDGTVEYLDTEASAVTLRFYRARWQPLPEFRYSVEPANADKFSPPARQLHPYPQPAYDEVAR